MTDMVSIPKAELDELRARGAGLPDEAKSLEREFNRALLESMSDGVVACDADGVLTLFNRAAREWHGTDPLRLLPEEWPKHYDLFRADGVTPLPPDEVPLARAFRGETVTDAGMAIAARGRPVRFILANGSAIFDEAGRKIGAVVVMRDVTELKRAEAALRRANEQLEARVQERTQQLERQYVTLRGILDSATAPIFSVDRQYRYTAFNTQHAEVMAALYGAQIEIGGSMLECMSLPEDRAEAKRNLDRALAGEPLTKEAFSGEDARARQFFRVTQSPIKSETGDVIGAAVFAHDLTDRKRAEEQLRESEQRYRYVFDNVSDGLCLLDVLEDGRLRAVEANPAFERLTGIPRVECVGKTQDELALEGVVPVVLEKCRRCADAGWPIEAESELELPSGRIHFLSTLVPARDALGRVSRIVAIERDITAQRQAEQERLNHLRFFETMDRVYRALQGTEDPATAVGAALDVVLDALGCDRAFLLFPCDPGAPAWTVPMERSRPEFRGVHGTGDAVPTDPEVAQTFRIVLAASGPVKFGPATGHALPVDVAERFGFRSLMAMAVRPRAGKPWQFGVHQCSFAREWTAEDERLLSEIGRRLADGLSNLLARQDLRESEAKYRALYNNTPVMLHSMDREGRLISVSDYWLASLGYTREEVLGRSPADFLTDSSRKLAAEVALPELLQTGHCHNVGLQFSKKDGVVLECLMSAVSERGAGGEVARSLAVITDITERKRAEEELQRVNRHLRATSDCNQVLIRATDEGTLLNDVCRIICEQGGYRLAWVGYAAPDDEVTIQPVAVAGSDDGYVREVTLSWAEAQRGAAPAAEAMRRGATVCVQDLGDSPSDGPWLDSARQRGYRSAVWLPLRDASDRTFGLLLIYSAEANAFSPQELGLLEELASDLAFGIQVLRDREDLKRAEQQRAGHLRFLEAMDRVNQAVHRSTELDSMLSDVLDVVLSVFACDRAWLVYPCDPAASAFRVSVERSRPEYAATSAVGIDVPVVQEISELLTTLRTSDGPTSFGPGSRHPLPRGMADSFHIASQLATAIYPKNDEPYAFGIHQCSHARLWTPEEARLMEEIGRRLADGLSTVLAHRRVRESEQRYRMVFDSSPVPIREEDFSEVKTVLSGLAMDGASDMDAYLALHPDVVRRCASLVRVLDVNKAALALHGARTKDELLAGLDCMLTTRSFEAFRHELACVWNGATHLTLDAVIRTLAGDARDVTVYFSVCPGYEDSLARVVVSTVDITERKRAEDALLKLSSAIEQSPVSIIITDVQGRIEFVNPKFTQLTGYSFEEVRGRNPRFLKSELTSPAEHRRLWAAITQGNTWAGTFCNRKKSGELFWEDATIAPIKNRDGHVTHYIAVKEDVTDKKRLEDQLRQAQKMEAIGTLAGGVAHDFNNILTAIFGYTNIVKLTMAADDPLQAELDEVLAASERAAQLTRGLLAFSRKQVMSLKAVDLNDIVGNVERLLRRLVGEDVELSTRLCVDRLTAIADTGQIEQVLMNLAANARDAMPDGGVLSICTRVVTVDEEFGMGSGHGQAVRNALITVSDTGIGMDAPTQQKVFEPFFTTKEPGKGTGLGLAIVYGIIKQHGGMVRVKSEVGAGTTFEVYLPLAEETAEQSVAAPITLPPGGTETILVAEDDQAVRSLACAVLRRFGYRVVEAVDGLDAMEKLAEQATQIDLVISDVIMPRRSGRDVRDAVKTMRPEVPVLFVSGYTADIIHGKGIMEEGMQFLPKPVNPFDLLRRVRQLLDQRRPSIAPRA